MTYMKKISIKINFRIFPCSSYCELRADEKMEKVISRNVEPATAGHKRPALLHSDASTYRHIDPCLYGWIALDGCC